MFFLIESYPCANVEELNKREGEHQKANPCINKYIAGRTPKEWYNENRVERLAYQKNYDNTNIDRIRIYKIGWRKENKEKNRVYQQRCREKKKLLLKEKNEIKTASS